MSASVASNIKLPASQICNPPATQEHPHCHKCGSYRTVNGRGGEMTCPGSAPGNHCHTCTVFGDADAAKKDKDAAKRMRSQRVPDKQARRERDARRSARDREARQLLRDQQGRQVLKPLESKVVKQRKEEPPRQSRSKLSLSDVLNKEKDDKDKDKEEPPRQSRGKISLSDVLNKEEHDKDKGKKKKEEDDQNKDKGKGRK